MAAVIFLTIFGLLIALIGIEMVNTPPTKSWHKWFYRIGFLILGFGVIVLTCLQYKGEEEKSKRTYESFANVISNEMIIRNSQTNQENAISSITIDKPNLVLSINGETNLTTSEFHPNSSWIPNNFVALKNREIFFQVENLSPITADHITIDFSSSAQFDPTNLSSSGWAFYGKDAGGNNEWHIVANDSLSQFGAFNSQTLTVLSSYTNLFMLGRIIVHADRSKTSIYYVLFLFQN